MAIPVVLNNPTFLLPVPPAPPLSGELYSWGNNTNYQAGTGSNTSPLQIPTIASGGNIFTKIAVFDSHVLAIKTDGTLWAWGDNAEGQLGLGDQVTRTTPTQVGLDTDWADIDVGFRFSVAMKDDGSVYTFGLNDLGQLGLGDTTRRTSPTLVSGITATKIAAGTDQYPGSGSGTLILKTDGSLWYAGSVGYGQNNGVVLDFNSFREVASSSYGFVDMAVGGIYNLAVDGSGNVWGIGYNNEGQLGASDTSQKNTWFEQPSGHSFTKVITGFRISYGLKSDGSVWGWGRNAGDVSFGSGNAGDKITPVLVQSGPYVDISMTRGWGISEDNVTGFGLKADGTLDSWGYNNVYQFGNNTLVPSSSASAVSAGNGLTFTKLSRGAGKRSGFALKS